MKRGRAGPSRSDAPRVARPPPDSYDPRTTATSSLRVPILGVLALVLVALLGLAWHFLDSGSSAPLSPERTDAPTTQQPSVELVAAGVEPERARAVDESIPITEPIAARTPDLSIRGRVVREDGGGITDVDVLLLTVNGFAKGMTEQSAGSPKKPFATTKSETNGSFQFAIDSSPVGAIAKFQLATKAPGWSATWRWIDVPSESKEVDVGDLVLTRSCTVRGIVRDANGAPVERAGVSASVVNVDGTRSARGGSARTAADGTFVLQDAPSGKLMLSAYEEERGSAQAVPVELDPGDDRAGIELVLSVKDDSTSISGVVLDVDGTPLAKVPISMSHSTRNSTGGGGGAGSKHTDAQGRFHFRGETGSFFHVSARHPRGEAGTATLADIPAGTHGIVLKLTPITLATLRVTSTDGAPIVRFAFRVSLQLERMSTAPTTSKLADRVNGECPLPLPDAEFWIQIEAPGFATTEFGPFQPSPNPGVIEVRLEPLPAVRGFVVRGNEPVVGALVRAQRALTSFESWSSDGFRLVVQPCEGCPMTKTAADGSFALDIGQPGAWHLRAESAGDVSALSEPIEVTGRRAYGEVRIDLALRGSIRGHVRSESGSPLVRRRVSVSAGDGDHREAKTEADGAYEFEGLAPGGYQVRLLDRDDGPPMKGTSSTTTDTEAPPIVWDCHVADGRTTTHDIVVPGRAQLAVRIVADESVVPSHAWEVSAVPKPSVASSTTVRAMRHPGGFVFDLPHAGSWDTVASVESPRVQLSIAHVLEVTSGPVTKLHVFTISKGSIRGRVAAGTVGVEVSLSGLTSAGDWVSATTTASADGTFEFPFAFEGSMEFDAEGAREKRRRITIVGGIVNDVGEL